MATLPDLSIKKADAIVEKIYEAYEARERKGQNERIGASDLGGECDRALWYSYRWASAKSFGGRMLRLFQSGHLQEPRVIDDLRAIGCTVISHDDTGKQFKIVEGPIVMKPDGIVSGVPGAEQTAHVLEIKTHSEKSYKTLVKDGVQKSKPDHFVQTQIEMLLMKLTRALYVAVNKNTDEMYAERIELSQLFAEAAIARGKKIAAMTMPPSKISEDPAFFKCRFCDNHSVCHMEKVAQVNCRTCCYSEALEDGSWYCGFWDVTLEYKQQQEGCEKHLFIPDLVPNSKVIDADPLENFITYESDGVQWRQGENYIASRSMVDEA